MDYEAANSREGDEGEAELAPVTGAPLQGAALSAATVVANAVPLAPGPDNTIVLPAGVTLDDVTVQGRDLVIRAADGATYVVHDGAVFVPTLVIDGVSVPPLNLAALLVGAEIQPAAGQVQSSGNNFADPVGDIQSAYSLGDLLPYTELNFGSVQNQEVIPGLIDRNPDVLIQDGGPASRNAVDTVSEAGLLASRGAGESAGSNAGNGSSTTTGSIIVDSPDGVASITVNGVTLTGSPGQSITTGTGVLTLGSLSNGLIPYTYTLSDNTSGDTTADVFTVIVTDPDGDTATATLSVNIIDDVPTARADSDAVAAGSFAPEGGNVITGTGTTEGTGGSGTDTKGADGAAVSQIVSVNVPANSDTTADGLGNFQVAGQYGNLVINQDGTYTYTRNAGTPGGVTDTFTYTLKDGDGDTSPANLVITIGNGTPTISDLTPAANGGDVTVDEDDLLDGSDPAPKDPLTQPGTFTVTSPDGIASLVIDGHTVITNGVFSAASWTTPLGNTLAITGYNAGVVSYTYTLTDNEAHANAAGQNALFEDFTVTLTDLDGQFDTDILSARIIDDVPTAANDVDSIAAGTNGPATGNVITGIEVAVAEDGNGTDGVADVQGADGARVSFIDNASTPGALVPAGGSTSLAGLYGTLTIYANGDYSYARTPGAGGGLSDVFTYTLTDADGDESPATLTISIGNSPPVISDLTPAANGGDVTVDEDDLLDGSDPAPKDPLTQPGTFTVTSPDGIASLVIDGHTVITNGVFSAASWTTPLGNTLAITGYNAGVVSYTYTLTDNEAHANAAGQNALFEDFTVTLTDLDGQFDTDILSARIIDDVPTLGTVQSQQASNSPAQTPAVGTLHLVPGADGVGSMTITANLTGITSGGHTLKATMTSASVLTGYYDADNSNTFNAGDTAVFTLTVNPAAGTSGQYTFDLLQPLDGAFVDTAIGGSASFGAGPTQSQILTATGTGQNLAVVSGWQTTGTFNEAAWYAGGNPPASQLTLAAVNGSTSGWGVDSNTFDLGEFMRFDFGALNDYDAGGPYATPAVTLPAVHAATFDLIQYGNGDTVKFVMHLAGGGVQVQTVTNFTSSIVTLTAPNGVNIDWIDVYVSTISGGSGKIDLVSVSAESTVVDATIPFTLVVTDGDGDVTATQPFSVHVKDGLTPLVPAPPIVLDLDGNGAEFISLAAGIRFDYDGDGLPTLTAWAGKNDGILAIDLNGNGKVDNGSEIVFGGNGLTDLQGLAAHYDSNHDGVLDAKDADFAKFGVWQDANSNGVADAGEFKSLSAAGIVSISLTSDNKVYSAAAGDVTVNGTATYTKADGTTSTLADATFATDAERQAVTAQLTSTATAATGVVAAAIVAASDAPEAQAAPAAAANDDTAPAANIAPETATAHAEVSVHAEAAFAQASPQTAAPQHQASHGEAEGEPPSNLTATDHTPAPASDDAVQDSPAPASAFAFGNDDAHVMDALLAANLPAPAPTAPVQALAAVQDALVETAANQAVDAVVDHFAGATEAPAAPPAADPSALHSLLFAQVGPAADHAMPIIMPHIDDHSAAFAAVA